MGDYVEWALRGGFPEAALNLEGQARHLVWLRGQLGERFVRGVVLHTGPYTFPLADRILAAPISTLWAP